MTPSVTSSKASWRDEEARLFSPGGSSPLGKPSPPPLSSFLPSSRAACACLLARPCPRLQRLRGAAPGLDEGRGADGEGGGSRQIFRGASNVFTGHIFILLGPYYARSVPIG